MVNPLSPECSFCLAHLDLVTSYDVNFLSLCHVNIRSARKNLGAFENYLNILKHEFTVIALTETWLNDNVCDLYGLSGYKVIGRHRVNRTGGGVAVCIQDHVSFRERPDLFSSTEDFEPVFIEIEKGNQQNARNVLIGGIYRPPNQDILLFNEKLNNIMTDVRVKIKHVIFLEIIILIIWIMLAMYTLLNLLIWCQAVDVFLSSLVQPEWLPH